MFAWGFAAIFCVGLARLYWCGGIVGGNTAATTWEANGEGCAVAMEVRGWGDKNMTAECRYVFVCGGVRGRGGMGNLLCGGALPCCGAVGRGYFA